jgi:hypothetical protein
MPESDIVKDIRALRKLTVSQLAARYFELFGEETRSRNRDHLFKRVAHGLQERALGGLSARAKRRLEELPVERVIPVPRKTAATTTARLARAGARAGQRRRAPAAGTVLEREFRGTAHKVTVTASGFEYRGKVLASLSAAAREITGTQWNGWTFFRLARS